MNETLKSETFAIDSLTEEWMLNSVKQKLSESLHGLSNDIEGIVNLTIILKRENDALKTKINGLLDALKEQTEKAEERYVIKQMEGDEISAASTCVELVVWRDARCLVKHHLSQNVGGHL